MPSTVTFEGVEFTRYVQSTFKVKTPAITVFLDPHRFTAAEVGPDKADLILVTHPHPDHMDPEAIKVCAKDNAVVVTNPAVERALPEEVKKKYRVVAIKAGESTTQKSSQVKAVEGYGAIHPREQGFNTAFVFTIGGKRVFHAGDTDKVPELAQAAPVDIALVPIGNGRATMGEEDAADLVNRMLKPRCAIPMHYGYATGGDPEKFRSLVQAGIRVEVLEPVLKVKYR